MINPKSKEQNLGIGFYYEKITGDFDPVLEIRAVMLEGELTCVPFGRTHNMMPHIIKAAYPYPGIKRILPVYLIPNSLNQIRNNTKN